MEFRILGPLEVVDDDRRLTLGGPKPRAVLAILLLRANKVVPAGQLIEALWGDTPPPTAMTTVQVYVSRLRRILQPPKGPTRQDYVLMSRPLGYLLRVQPGDLDLHRFQGLVDGAHQALRDRDPARAAAGLRAALGLWRGPALCDVDADALRWVEAPRLEELRLAALETRIDAELRLGLHARLVGELQALVAAHPVRERFAGQLMLALYRSGRQADALEVFGAARRRLIEDLGLEPDEDLQGLHRAILAGDAELCHHAGTTDHTGLLSRPPGPIPHELPGPIAEFTGRTQELREITSLLEVTSRAAGQPVTISAVDGMGGIGKSALAIQGANQFPDGQLYVNLHGATPGQPPLTP